MTPTTEGKAVAAEVNPTTTKENTMENTTQNVAASASTVNPAVVNSAVKEKKPAKKAPAPAKGKGKGKVDAAPAAEAAAAAPVVLTAEQEEAGWKKFAKATGVDKAEVLHIPLDMIKVQAGFNPREMDKPETQAKIKGLKESYKLGNYVKPLEVMLAGDHVEIVDGEGRYTAAVQADKELKKAGKPGIPYLVCVPFTGNEVQRLILTVQGNEGEKLTQLEQSEVVARLQGLGWKREVIAKTLGFSIGWIDRLIVLRKMPEKVKALVRDGKVAPDVAAEYFKKHGDNTEAELKALMKEAKEGSKVTKKDAKKKPAEEKEPTQGQINKQATAEAVQILAAELPDFGMPKSAIRMTEVYKVELTGKALKQLMLIQSIHAPDEVEEAE
jgi:ParB-like chromosome segregation protein Spo0J